MGTKRRDSAKIKILWADSDESNLSAGIRLLHEQEYQLITTTSASEAQEIIKNEPLAAVLAAQNIPQMPATELLEYCRQTRPDATRVLLTGLMDANLIQESVNRSRVFKIIELPWQDSEFINDIADAVDHFEEKTKGKELLEEVKLQNKQLESMTLVLEKGAEEKKLHSDTSKRALEKNLDFMRTLVHFIREVGRTKSPDEILALTRLQLRPFHTLRDPVLAYRVKGLPSRLIYFSGQHINEVSPLTSFPLPTELQMRYQEGQRYLASELGRPVAKVIAVPMVIEGGDAVIFIEQDIDSDTETELVEFLKERLQPLQIALDRTILEMQMFNASLQWESIFDGIRDPMALIDSNYLSIRGNRVFVEGHSGKKCYQQFQGREDKCLGCPVETAMATGEAQIGTVRRGTDTFEVYSYPIQSAGQDRNQIVINYYMSVTRSRELLSKMIQNEKIAALGLLAGNIAHELNNPLTGIRSLAQFHLQREQQGSTFYSDLAEVEKAASRCEQIIQNLLDFSESADKPKAISVLPNEIISRTLPLLKTAMRQHNSEIHLCDSPAKVNLEPQLLQQLIFNLVNNACQAMNEPGVLILETKVSSDPPGKNWFEICVKDTGPGIKPEMLGQIFEPFYTTKKSGEGTGLGLSLSRSIVERIGGKISVESEMNKGTEFLVKLPIEVGSL